MTRSWLRDIWKQRPAKRKAPSFRFRPTLESLEGREVPALLTPAAPANAGTTPQAMVVADFNNDGIKDVAVSSGTTAAVSVLLGDGNGGFQAPVTTTVNAIPTDIAAGDFTGDGRTDLVLVFGNKTVTTLEGAGNGQFGTSRNSSLIVGNASKVEVADFNKDGTLDAVVASGSSVQYGAGLGGGRFLFGLTQTNVGGTVNDIAVADIDQDSNLDLVVATSGGGAAVNGVVYVKGNGNFGASIQSIPSTAGLNATGIAVGNFDGNNSPDVVVSFSNAAPAILKNSGGTFTLDTTSLGAAGANLPTGTDIAAADFNQDGVSDVAVLSSGSVYVAASDGLTGFVADPDGPYTAAGAAELLAADFNKDGPPDLTVSSPSGNQVLTLLSRFNTTTTITNASAPVEYGQALVVTAQVRPGVDVAANTNYGGLRGSVNFYVNGLLIGSSPVNLLGQASFTIPTGAGAALPVGIDNITAVFTGNTFFKASTSAPFGQQVTPGTAAIALTGGGTSTVGQQVTFTATLTPSLLPPNVVGPTGTVTFTDGTTVLGTAPVVKSGTGAGTTYTATFTTSSLAAASYTVTATYNGDTNWNTNGPSNSVSATVSAASTTVSLTPSPASPVGPGQAVTLNVTVNGNSITPTGTVLFLNGTQVIGSKALVNGSASLTTTALPTGANRLSVTYLGDGVYPTSSSSVVPYTVLTGNEFYVRNAYQLLLGRTPDSGATGWVTALNNGAPPQNIILGIQASAEYLTLEANGLYFKYLGRAASFSERQGWVQYLTGGGTFEGMTVGILASAEYSSLHTSNSEFVTALFQQVLGRTPTAADVNAWVAVLDGGASRATVATGFVYSIEYKQNLVRSYYTTFLGRPADMAGLNAWVAALSNGATDQQVLAGIFGSPEGFAKWSNA